MRLIKITVTYIADVKERDELNQKEREEIKGDAEWDEPNKYEETQAYDQLANAVIANEISKLQITYERLN